MADLTNKQKAFIEEYLKDFNATRAARRAGYGGSAGVLAAQGSRLLKNAKVSARISERLRESAMMADEILMRLSEQARIDISDFLKEYGAIDWEAVDKKGHLVKKIVHTKGKQSTIEVYDSQRALELLGKAHGLFKDRVDVTSGDEPLEPDKIIIYRSDDSG